MKREYTAIIERDGEWFVGYCPEIPGANGQGKTTEECLADLGKAIELILSDRGEGSGGGLPRAEDDQPLRAFRTIGPVAQSVCRALRMAGTLGRTSPPAGGRW